MEDLQWGSSGNICSYNGEHVDGTSTSTDSPESTHSVAYTLQIDCLPTSLGNLLSKAQDWKVRLPKPNRYSVLSFNARHHCQMTNKFALNQSFLSYQLGYD